ncbi:MAG: CDP-diacylglycerol--serine O-phosphatidyltransferase [Myxococcaceae bacterium]|nr:CDP-diacylglycerol--serine O-phosphatidyltransferase [Myxococcaceae bacterium]
MKLRHLMFVLPNLFTVSSIFCGFYALSLCAGDAQPAALYQAALSIFFGIFFDGFDGRVARLTKTQSAFGMELDSLADVITFGVAPAMLLYQWALKSLGFGGLFLSFAFAACGAIRLARFNVIAQRNPHGGGSRFFVGLPIPLAAGVVISMVIAHHGAQGGVLPESARGPVAVAVVFLSLLMVSTVRYRTFKDLRLSRRSALAFMAILVGGVVIGTQLHPAWVLVAYFSAYLLLGLVESAILLGRYVVERRTAAAEALLDEDDDQDDEEAPVDEQEVL